MLEVCHGNFYIVARNKIGIAQLQVTANKVWVSLYRSDETLFCPIEIVFIAKLHAFPIRQDVVVFEKILQKLQFCLDNHGRIPKFITNRTEHLRLHEPVSSLAIIRI